jgi:hypothetical protein
MNRLSERKKAELRLIAQLTVEATLGAEEKIARLAEKERRPGQLAADVTHEVGSRFSADSSNWPSPTCRPIGPLTL